MSNYKMIDMQMAKAMMATENDYVILDVRTAPEYEAGYIPNAINVPLETIRSTALKEVPDKDKLVMIYCRSGVRSKMAAEKLAEIGYNNIYEFGGIIDWNGDVDVDY